MSIQISAAGPERGVAARPATATHMLRLVDLSGTVLPLGNGPCEIGVGKRVVLDLHREPLLGRIERRLLGDRPALEHAVGL